MTPEGLAVAIEVDHLQEVLGLAPPPLSIETPFFSMYSAPIPISDLFLSSYTYNIHPCVYSTNIYAYLHHTYVYLYVYRPTCPTAL